MNYGSGAFVGLGLCREIIIFRRRKRDRQYVFEGCNNSIMCYGDGHKYLYFSLFVSIHSCIYGSLHQLLPGTQFSLLRLLSSPCFTAPVSLPHPVFPGLPAALVQIPAPSLLDVPGLPWPVEDSPSRKVMGLASCWCYLITKTKPISQQQSRSLIFTALHMSQAQQHLLNAHSGSVPPKIGFLDADGLLKSLQNQKVVACTDLPGGLAAWRTHRDSELMSVITAKDGARFP